MATETPEQIIETARTKVREQGLRVGYIDAKPQNFDFGENRWSDDDEPSWEFMEAVECDDCGRCIVEGNDHGFVDGDGNAVDIPEHPDDFEANGLADERELERCPRNGDDFREFDSAEGPMMNFRYPIGDKVFNADSARAIGDLPLCIVQFDDGEVYLALTGGGMDLSWEICEAYVTLGFLPPTHFRLPAMADKYLNEKTALVVAAVEYASEIQANWATANKEDASRLFANLKPHGGAQT